MDGQTERVVPAAVIGHIQHRAAGFCLVPQHAGDPCPGGHGGGGTADLIQHLLADGLDHQAGSDRAGRVELVKDGDGMCGAGQVSGCGQPADPGADDGDFHAMARCEYRVNTGLIPGQTTPEGL